MINTKNSKKEWKTKQKGIGMGFFFRRFNNHWAYSNQLNTYYLWVKENETCSKKWTHPFPRQYHSQMLTIHCRIEVGSYEGPHRL